MSKNLVKVEELVVPIIEKLGLTFVDCDLKKEFGTLTLTIYIDNENGGVTLDDCEKVSNAINEPLDEIDVSNGKPYNLNVSSPGLDRPLKKEIDFKRNLNKEVEVKFYKPFVINGSGKKTISGILVKYSDSDFTLNINNQEITINKTIAALISPVIKF